MAKSAAAIKETGSEGAPETGETKPESALPDGFQDGGMPDLDGWFKAEKGHVVWGKICGVFQVENDDGKLRQVVLVKLIKPCKAVVDGEEGVELGVGKVVGVGITAKLAEMLYYVDSQAQVFLRCKEKVKLGKGGKTMWKYDLGFKGGKKSEKPRLGDARVGTKGGGGSGDDDDLPF